MEILEYKFEEKKSWDIDALKLNQCNLLVGRSGMGKSRILNTITNLFAMVTNNRKISIGVWKIKFKILDDIFLWDIELNEKEIVKESLIQNNDLIFERNADKFYFKKSEIPKLDKTQFAFKLLCEENIIKPIFQEFNKLLRRNFNDADLEKQCANVVVLDKFKADKLPNPNSPLTLKLYYLKNNNAEIFNKILQLFKESFDNVLDIEFKSDKINNQNIIQTIIIEDSANNKIQLQELASGMKKLLLILTDIFTVENNSIYIIDELENSLGDNVIDAFPHILNQTDKKIQYIITSHHPYIISNIPVEDWFILFREKKHIAIKSGAELAEKFENSKQNAFVKLQNLDFFQEGE